MKNRSRTRRRSRIQEEIRLPQNSLNDLSTGQSGIVSHLDGDKELLNRIASLGFSIGAHVTVLTNHGRGPMVVSVLGTHFVLGREEADLIQVHSI